MGDFVSLLPVESLVTKMAALGLPFVFYNESLLNMCKLTRCDKYDGWKSTHFYKKSVI